MRTRGSEYIRRFGYGMSLDQIRAVRAISECHTPDAGSALWRCKSCGHRHFTYRGCGNRHCPSCGTSAASEWLRRQCALLLPGVTYHLVTFTVPAGLRRSVRSHPRELLDLLMRISSSTLLDLCSNPEWVGGKPGVTAVLHTWARNGEYHPHVHFIATGGGLDSSGIWRCSHPKFLVPVHAMSIVFRARLRDAIKEKHPEIFARIKPSVWKWSKKWVAHSKPVGSGENAYRYLARYIHRIYLTDQTILSHDENRVTVRYRKSGTNEPATIRLEPMEFLRRFLQHVLPSGFRKVRHYGLHHSSKRETVRNLQAAMSFAMGLEMPERPGPEAPKTVTCPECHSEMSFVRLVTHEQRFKYSPACPRGPPQ